MRVLTASRKSTAPVTLGATVSCVIDIGPSTRVVMTTAMSGAPWATATATNSHDELCVGHERGARRSVYRLIDDDALPAQRGL